MAASTYKLFLPTGLPLVNREKSLEISCRWAQPGHSGFGSPASIAWMTEAQSFENYNSATSTVRATTRCFPPRASQNKTIKIR